MPFECDQCDFQTKDIWKLNKHKESKKYKGDKCITFRDTDEYKCII